MKRMNTPTNEIKTVLIGGKWHVEDLTTGFIYGPFGTSWAAIVKMQELRAGKTAQAATTAKKNSQRYER